MTIDDQIRDEKLQYSIDRVAAKISALSSGKIDKYEYVTGEEILPSKQKQIIQQGKTKTVESNKRFDIESHKILDELSHEIMSEIKDLSRQTDLNNLTYYFKSKSISPINLLVY